MATTESMFPDRSDFDYDYETLRTTGVVLAVVMFVSGILIALSKKFTKCFQLIWYPNTKDRGASSNCIENVTLEKGRSRHGNPASKNAHKHTNTGCLWPSLLWLIYLCQLDDQYTGFSNTS